MLSPNFNEHFPINSPLGKKRKRRKNLSFASFLPPFFSIPNFSSPPSFTSSRYLGFLFQRVREKEERGREMERAIEERICIFFSGATVTLFFFSFPLLISSANQPNRLPRPEKITAQMRKQRSEKEKASLLFLGGEGEERESNKVHFQEIGQLFFHKKVSFLSPPPSSLLLPTVIAGNLSFPASDTHTHTHNAFPYLLLGRLCVGGRRGEGCGGGGGGGKEDGNR